MYIKKYCYQIVFGFLLLLSLFVKSVPVTAASILDAPNVSIPTATDNAPSKYTFIAKYNQEKTTVKTFGENWLTTDYVWENGKQEKFFSLRPQVEHKGKNGVIYSNVGSYEGKSVDLKITINDWSQFTKYQGYISYSQEDISHFAQGYAFVDQVWEFLETDSGKPLKVSGFMTINDIDGGQGIQFSKESSAAIDKIYVSSPDNWINYENISGEYKFFDATGKSSENEDLFATFTFLYSEQSVFRFKWCVDKDLLDWDYSTINFEQDYPNDPGYLGAYFGYIAKKPLKTELLAPIKKNSDSDEALVDKNTLFDRHEVQTYVITHQVPDEYEQFYYQSYSFEDALDPVFEIQGVSITDETGKDCNDLFEKNIHDNKVSYTAKPNVLSDPNFYGHYYLTEIHAVIRQDAELTFIDGIVQLKNKAKVQVDEDTKESNQTSTDVLEQPYTKPMKKVLNEAGEDIHTRPVFPGDILIYEIDQKVNEWQVDISAKYTEFIISDQLPKQLVFVSAKLLRDGKEISAETIHYDEPTHTVTFEATSKFLEEMPMQSETYTLQITAQVIAEMAENEIIENMAIRSINHSTLPTNKVENPSELKKGSITINKVIEQPIDIKQGNEVSHELIWGRTDLAGVTYQVKAHEAILYPNGEQIVAAGHDYGTITTDETGQAIIKNLYAGVYSLTEIAAPAGIQLKSEPIIVTLKEADETKVLATVVDQEDELQQVKITVHKVFEQEDGTYTSADGAVFGLYYADDRAINQDKIIKANTLVSTIEIAAGIGTYTGHLFPGQRYYLQEITTQPDYQLNKNKFHFVYTPVSNEAIHEIELYENGLIDNGTVQSYPLEKDKKSEALERSTLLPIKNHRATKNSITKAIIKEANQEVDHYEGIQPNEKITFKGQISFGSEESKTVQVTDYLPTGFVYESSKVYDAQGDDITQFVTITVAGQEVVLTVKPEYVSKLVNTTISWLLTTVYQFEDGHQNQVFKNQMHLIVDEQSLPSNTVTLTPAQTNHKPAGMLPSTGELLRFGSIFGGLLLVSFVVYQFRKKEQETNQSL